jgi:hypothetical protein
MMSTNAAPFLPIADAIRDLRDRFVRELGNEAPQAPNPWCLEFMGKLASLITNLEHLDARLQSLERHDNAAYEAFLRAMEDV